MAKVAQAAAMAKDLQRPVVQGAVVNLDDVETDKPAAVDETRGRGRSAPGSCAQLGSPSEWSLLLDYLLWVHGASVGESVSALPLVRAVLERIDAIEALGIAPSTASPAYWRTLANRLAAHLALPEYSAERHAAWLAGRALP